MKKRLDKIRKIVILILTMFSLIVTISNYLNLYTFDLLNSKHYPSVYSVLMIMIWLYILILGRKKIFEILKKKSILTILMIILTVVSLFATLKVWAGEFKYTNFILFSFINLAISYIEINKKVKR